MDKATLTRLQSVHKYPSVSILLPTHRTAPDNQQDHIRLKNLIKQAEERLLQEFDKRTSDAVMQQVHAIADKLDVNYNLDGLAIFANADMAERVDFPFAVAERVVIDETFATRDLIKMLNRSSSYYVMTLSGHKARLFSAARDQLTEVRAEGFPYSHEAGVNASRGNADDHDRAMQQIFNPIDKAFNLLYNAQPMDLVLAGSTENLSHYREIADNKKLIYAAVEGNYDNHTPHDIGKIVWPVVREQLSAERAELIGSLQAARSQEKAAVGLDECWQLAQQGRIDTLLLEENYSQPGTVSENGQVLHLTDDATAPGIVDDLLDELAEHVIQTGGRVAFFENGGLTEFGRVGAVLRY